MPKTKEQCLLIKEKRRKDILKISLYQFAFKGYKAVKVDDITKAAKTSHGLFYHYFKDTEDLFHSLMEENVLPYIHNIVFPTINEDKPAVEILHTLFDKVMSDIGSKDTDKACMLFLLLNLHLQKEDIPKPRKISQDDSKHRKLYGDIKGVIERGQKEGSIIDYDSSEITVTILSMINGLAFNRVNLGYEKFICPKGQMLTEMLKKKGE